jgi:hypothetical protein
MTLVGMLPDKIRADYLNGELFWRIRELNLCIFGASDQYVVILCKVDDRLGPPVGLHTLAANISAKEVVRLISKLENEVTHAVHWISQDALDGIFRDPGQITKFYDLWSENIDPYLYKCGCGHLARSYVKGGGRTAAELKALTDHSTSLKEDGLIGKGLPTDYGQPNQDASIGFDKAIEQALDCWIRDGGIAASISNRPRF